MRKYKILYIGNFNSNSVGEPEIAKALEELGHQVTRIDTRDVSLDFVEMKIKQYDFLLCSKFQLTLETVAKEFIKSCPIPTICWMFDLYWGYYRSGRISSDAHFQADLIISTDDGHPESWKKAGIKHVCIRQGISSDVKKGVKKEIVPEIGFIGTLDPAKWQYRHELVTFLDKTYGKKFKHYGSNGGLRHEALNDTIASLKIVIGDSVQSPHYWSNRLYEMIGRGAFLIRPLVEGIEKEFLPYKHFIPYNYGNFEGLKEKIDYYLEHNVEREKIRKAGHKHCHENHTYTHRAKVLIETIEKCLLKKSQ